MNRQAIYHTGLTWAMGTSFVVLAAALGWAQATTQSPESQSKTDPKINDAFKKPDVRAYVKKFESDEREAYVRRHEIVAALGLTPGMAVADIGAGTGLFTRLVAEKAGAKGKVYAVEISPEFLAHISADAKKRGTKQIVTLQGNQETSNLPKGSIDLAFLSDVYHHLERPQRYLGSLREALKPDGRLVVVEFDRVEGRSSAFVLKHVRAGRDVFIAEIESAGFKRVTATKPPALKENFLAAFEKVPADDRTNANPRRAR
jgi:SAM-dependent methyltransferase